MLRSSPRALPYSGPTLKFNGPDLKHDSPTWTIPDSVSVGDYMVIVGNNGTSMNEPNAGGYGWSYVQGTGGSSTYSEASWIRVKVATAADVGVSYTISAGGYQFMAQAYVFTNPNNTSLGYGQSIWYTRSVAYGGPYNSGARSQQTFPAWSRALGPNCLRLFGAAMNGDSIQVSSSWTGGLTTRQTNDGYWWRGSTSGWVSGATGLETPTVYFNQGGALAWTEIYLP